MVSVIALAHNYAQYTRACLLSVLQTKPPDLEIVVVNNGSSDETPQVLSEIAKEAAGMGVNLKMINLDRNLGCCTARNMAVAEAVGEEIVFVDNDTVMPDPRWIEKLQRVLDNKPQAAIVGPKLCYPVAPYNIQCAGVGISRSGRVLFRGRGHPQDDPRFNECEEVQCLISACWMFRRILYDEIGGLDEAYNPIQFEDFDFCYRARSKGHRVIYTPDPVVYHWESITSTGTASLNNPYVVVKNGMRFKKRWRHMFEQEDGPSDEDAQWQKVDMPSLDGPKRR